MFDLVVSGGTHVLPGGADSVDLGVSGGKIVAIGPMAEILDSPHPWVRAYFRGARGIQRANQVPERS